MSYRDPSHVEPPAPPRTDYRLLERSEDHLKAIKASTAGTAALLLLLLIAAIIGMIMQGRTNDQILKQLHEIDQAITSQPGNPATTPPDKK